MLKRVRIGGQTYYANCAGDALGVAAALDKDAVVETTDALSRASTIGQCLNNVRSTLRFRRRSGETISFTRERPCCSSGRKKRLRRGAKAGPSSETNHQP